MSTMHIDLVKQIDALLPQTQCTRCGYPSCVKYAEALVDNTAEINQCPPGGDEGILALAQLLERPVLALNPANGTIKPRQLLVIDEDVCIGCTLCIKACPVDAIVETHIHEYHGEKRGDLYFTKEMLLAIGDRYEDEIAANKSADAKYR